MWLNSSKHLAKAVRNAEDCSNVVNILFTFSQGWEKNGLFEFFKAKLKYMKDKERKIEIIERSPSPPPSPGQTPEYEGSPLVKDAPPRSRSASKSPPPQRQRSRSRSRSRERQKRRYFFFRKIFNVAKILRISLNHQPMPK